MWTSQKLLRGDSTDGAGEPHQQKQVPWVVPLATRWYTPEVPPFWHSHGFIIKLENECIEEEKKKLKYEAALRSQYHKQPEELKEQLLLLHRRAIQYFSGKQEEYQSYKARIEDYRVKASEAFIDSCKVNRDMARGLFIHIVNRDSNIVFDRNSYCLEVSSCVTQPFDKDEPNYEDVSQKLATVPVKVLKFDLELGEPQLSESTVLEFRTEHPDLTADTSQQKDPTVEEVQNRFKGVAF